MSQSTRQEARRRAQEQMQRRREALVAREARIRDHAIAVSATWLELQRFIVESEQRIGERLNALIVDENLTATEVAQLCGLERRDVNRLRRDHTARPERPAERSPHTNQPAEHSPAA